jgi:hypothetical protein
LGCRAYRSRRPSAHIPLLLTARPDGGVGPPGLLILAARLSNGMRSVRLLLDSGANAPLLYNTAQPIGPQLSHDVPLLGRGVDGAQRVFSALPLQDIKIDSLRLSRVAFFSLAAAQTESLTKGFDGILPTGLFRRVFVEHPDHFVVLEPR